MIPRYLPQHGAMVQHATGNYVAAADYDALLALLAELVEEADRTGGRDRTVQRVTVDRARALVAKARGES